MPRKPTTLPPGVYEKNKGSGVYYVRVKQGSNQYRQRVGTSVVEASKRYRELKAEIHEGKFPTAANQAKVTFADIGREAVDWYVSQRKKDVRTFTGRMKAIIASPLGLKPARVITCTDIDRWLDSLDCGPATKNRYRTIISKAFTLAMRAGKVQENPARLVERKPEENERVRCLSEGEESSLRIAVNRRCPVQLPALTFALNTGARRGEQFGLTWSSVDLDRKQVHFQRTKNGRSRYVQLNKAALAALRSIKRSESHNYVFAASRGDDRLRDPTKWFKSALAEAGVENFTWHDLRHTFISRLIMAGIPVAVVSKIAGHSDSKMTARYTHLSPGAHQEAVDALDADERSATDALAHSSARVDPSSRAGRPRPLAPGPSLPAS